VIVIFVCLDKIDDASINVNRDNNNLGVCCDSVDNNIVKRLRLFDILLNVIDKDAFLILVSYSLINFMKLFSFVILCYSSYCHVVELAPRTRKSSPPSIYV